jgi:opacity protein-like surface antigen
MRNTILIAAAVMTATTVASSAADLAMKAPAAPVSAWSWTGFYVGGNIGGGVATSRFDDLSNFFGTNPTPTSGFFTGGGQIGYNYQFGSGLVGVEADVNGNSHFNGAILGSGNSEALTVRSNIDVSGTIRARAGLVVGNTLVYATGGTAWADVEQQSGTSFCNFNGTCVLDLGSFPSGAPTGRTANFSGTKWGGVVGAGVEYALSPNWTVGGEFLHTIYADSAAPLLDPNGSNSCVREGILNPANCKISNHLTTDVARIRFNYKLN